MNKESCEKINKMIYVHSIFLLSIKLKNKILQNEEENYFVKINIEKQIN